MYLSASDRQHKDRQQAVGRNVAKVRQLLAHALQKSAAGRGGSFTGLRHSLRGRHSRRRTRLSGRYARVAPNSFGKLDLPGENGALNAFQMRLTDHFRDNLAPQRLLVKAALASDDPVGLMQRLPQVSRLGNRCRSRHKHTPKESNGSRAEPPGGAASGKITKIQPERREYELQKMR